MIQAVLQSDFIKMPWKNGRGVTNEISIFPAGAKIEKNDFLYRLSSAPIEQDSDFSLFPGKQRLLTPVKGAGFKLNSKVYEKFEVADFSGGEKTHCSLLKGPVLDFGVLFDPVKVKAKARILHLKSQFSFALDPEQIYFFTVLEGELEHEGQKLKELESLHYQGEASCQLIPVKSAVLFYLGLLLKNG